MTYCTVLYLETQSFNLIGMTANRNLRLTSCSIVHFSTGQTRCGCTLWYLNNKNKLEY